MYQVGITVKAESVVNQGDGHFTIMVSGRELPEDVQKIIRETFPHTADKVYDLLAVENVIGAIVPDYTPPKEPTFPYPQDVQPVKAKSPKY